LISISKKILTGWNMKRIFDGLLHKLRDFSGINFHQNWNLWKGKRENQTLENLNLICPDFSEGKKKKDQNLNFKWRTSQTQTLKEKSIKQDLIIANQKQKHFKF
jgi:hypothetical protein